MSSNGNVITKKHLRDFVKSPKLYHDKLLSGAYDSSPASADIFKSAIHTRFFEGGAALERDYAIGGPINEKTGKPYGSTTKAFLEWADEQGKPVISFDVKDRIDLIFESLAGQSVVPKSPAPCACVYEAVIEGIIVRVKPDGFSGSVIYELEVCDNLDTFEERAVFNGYLRAAALTVDTISLSGHAYPGPGGLNFLIMAVETNEPYRIGVWKVPQCVINEFSRSNRSYLGELAACNLADVWPTRYEDVRTFPASV